MTCSSIRSAVLFVPVAVFVATVASAQAPKSPPVPQVPRDPQSEQARVQISVMENLLERAVNEGIVATRSQIPEMVSVPFMLAGNNHARGFKVEGYGVFFDVEVPELPQSMTWSMRVLARNNDAAIMKELQDLKGIVAKAVTDEKDRAEAQRRIVNLQARISGVPPELAQGPQGTQLHAANSSRVVPTPAAVEERSPDEIYTEEVKNALVKAILDQGVAIPLAGDQWLTVAARGSEAPRTSIIGDQGVATMYLTMKGQDLQALRTGQISRDEARKRIKENHF